MSDERVEISREELYEKVWSTPMSQLAKEFGISDVGLAKKCKKLKIPRPGLGDWRRMKTGHKVKRPPLPPLKQEAPKVAVIEKREHRFKAIELTPEVQALVDAEALPENRITVKDSLHGCHRLVSQTNAARTRSYTDEFGNRQYSRAPRLDVRVCKESLHRALCILDALIRALEARGHQVSISDKQEYKSPTIVTILGEPVEVYLHETSHRVERPLNAQEQARKRVEPDWRPYNLYTYESSGTLALKIESLTYREGIQHAWSDTKKFRLEERLNDLVAGLIRAAALLKKERLEREEQHRRWEEERIQRAEEERRRKEEEARVQSLYKQAEAWEKSQRIRAFIEAVRAMPEGPVGGLTTQEQREKWIEWASGVAERLDPLETIPRDSSY